jgi:hypothetical protein
MSIYQKWFSPAVFIGMLINILGMSVPFLFAPQWMINWLGLPGSGDSIVWMRQAGILLTFISILYVSGGADPIRYRSNANFAVAARMTIGLYWFYLVFLEGRTTSFLIFGILDVIYASFLWFLLWKIRSEEDSLANAVS